MRDRRLVRDIFWRFTWCLFPAWLAVGGWFLGLSTGHLLAGGLALAAAVLLASLWTARRLNRPLQSLAEGVDRLAADDLSHRLYAADFRETRRLADSLNRLAERLEIRMAAITSQQHEQEAMLTSMGEGVLAVDREGTILNLNETCAKLLGQDAVRLRGRRFHEAIRKPDLLSVVELALAEQSPVERDVRIVAADDRWLHAHGTTLYDAQRRQIGALLVLHDVTRLRRLESVRRDFVANVSHELRTPITSIKGFVETLLDGAMDDRQTSARFLRIVLRQVNRLNAIIEDLLILSRIEKGSDEATIELGEDRVQEVLQAAIEMCEKQAQDKGITVWLECDPDLVARINAHLVEQAVVNLVGNAIKYSEAGSRVEVTACRQDAEVLIAVKDQGCGIEARHLPRLFERFYRVDKARSRELGGTGLGLAIVKHIALAHRGSIGVQSVIGSGSVFTLRLPSAPQGVVLTKI
jgi:two-component system phosphate regulon sensor histidine kinase PhoR